MRQDEQEHLTPESWWHVLQLENGSTCQSLIIEPHRATSEPIPARQYSDWMKYYRECAELEPEVSDAHNWQVLHVGGSSNIMG